MIVLRPFDTLRAQDERIEWMRLTGRLADKARRLAEAHAEARLRERRGDPRRWRLARLVWPLFAKG